MPSISLTLPISGTAITAGLHSANYSALSTLLNSGLDTANWAAGKVFPPSKLTQEGATDGQVVVWDNASSTWKAKTAPGAELAYAEYTASVNVVSTTEASSTSVVSAGSVTFDGTPVMIEFFSPNVQTPSLLGSYVDIGLWDSATQVGRLALVLTAAAAVADMPVFARRKLTPTAAAHTYSVQAFTSSTTGTPFVGAGAGGTATFLPGYIRITKA